MNLEEAKIWCDNRLSNIGNLDWYVVSWNDEFIVINGTRYDRHPEEWEPRVQYRALTKRRR